MKFIAPAFMCGKKALFALLGVGAILQGVDGLFEYGEGLADISAAEMFFLLMVLVLEWRFIVRCRSSSSTLVSAINQLDILGGCALLGAVIAALKSDGEVSATWQALSVLVAIQNSTPKPESTCPATESPA